MEKKKISTRIFQKEEETVLFKKSNALQSIVVSILIALLLFFVSYDYNMMKNKIETQIPIIYEQLDELNLYLEEKTPEINQTVEEYNTEIKAILNGKTSAHLITK